MWNKCVNNSTFIELSNTFIKSQSTCPSLILLLCFWKKHDCGDELVLTRCSSPKSFTFTGTKEGMSVSVVYELHILPVQPDLRGFWELFCSVKLVVYQPLKFKVIGESQNSTQPRWFHIYEILKKPVLPPSRQTLLLRKSSDIMTCQCKFARQ